MQLKLGFSSSTNYFISLLVPKSSFTSSLTSSAKLRSFSLFSCAQSPSLPLLNPLHHISSLPFCSSFPFFSVHFSHAGDLPNCERVKNWHNRLHTWHQRDSARWNTTDFLSNNLFFNPIQFLRPFSTHDVLKKFLEFHVFPGNWQFVGEILWVLDLDHPLPLFSWGHSWDIWVNWIATEWPQFIHCFSFCQFLCEHWKQGTLWDIH